MQYLQPDTKKKGNKLEECSAGTQTPKVPNKYKYVKEEIKYLSFSILEHALLNYQKQHPQNTTSRWHLKRKACFLFHNKLPFLPQRNSYFSLQLFTTQPSFSLQYENMERSIYHYHHLLVTHMRGHKSSSDLREDWICRIQWLMLWPLRLTGIILYSLSSSFGQLDTIIIWNTYQSLPFHWVMPREAIRYTEVA